MASASATMTKSELAKPEKKKSSKLSKSKKDSSPKPETKEDSSPEPETKKRKRGSLAEDEIEIDLEAPEPPSKKALRRLKKGKPLVSTADAAGSKDSDQDSDGAAAGTSEPAAKQRSDHGIWIGNLPFAVTKASLREFLTESSGISDSQITRIHMPAPSNAQPRGGIKPTNKGFAYVDFVDAETVTKAIALSELLLGGRPVLIKNAKSFEGRPAETKASNEGAADEDKLYNGKPPSCRVFIGNLGFDVTKEDLEKHFLQCGAIEHMHMATFEDSGKCKGFAWVTFADIEAAKSAVKGWILKEQEAEPEDDAASSDDSSSSSDSDSDSGSDSETEKRSKPKKSTKTRKAPKPRKWFVNKLFGRALRAEFAEDASVRYKKRFGSKPDQDGAEGGGAGGENGDGNSFRGRGDGNSRGRGGGGGRGRGRGRGGFQSRNVDARTIRPGAANANAPRASAAIVPGQGKRVTFD